MILLKIDNEFKNLLPPLTSDEYSQLEKEIIEEGGIHDPILVWNGYIVDGHNRYEICNKNGIKITKVETMKSLVGKEKSAVMDWIINHQTGRRNLTKSQLVKAYASVEEQLKREAKERQSAGGGDKRSSKAKSVVANLPQAIERERNAPTTEQVAKKLGVSRKTYEGMKTVVAEGSAEQIERMDKGGKGNGVSAIVAEIKEEKASKDVPEGYKRCCRCKQIKPIADFHNNKHQKDGKQSYCIQCDNERNAIRRSKNVFSEKTNVSDSARRMTLEETKRGLYDDVSLKVQTFDSDTDVFKNSLIFTFKNSFDAYMTENEESLADDSNKAKAASALDEFIGIITKAKERLI